MKTKFYLLLSCAMLLALNSCKKEENKDNKADAAKTEESADSQMAQYNPYSDVWKIYANDLQKGNIKGNVKTLIIEESEVELKSG